MKGMATQDDADGSTRRTWYTALVVGSVGLLGVTFLAILLNEATSSIDADEAPPSHAKAEKFGAEPKRRHIKRRSNGDIKVIESVIATLPPSLSPSQPRSRTGTKRSKSKHHNNYQAYRKREFDGQRQVPVQAYRASNHEASRDEYESGNAMGNVLKIRPQRMFFKETITNDRDLAGGLQMKITIGKLVPDKSASGDEEQEVTRIYKHLIIRERDLIRLSKRPRLTNEMIKFNPNEEEIVVNVPRKSPSSTIYRIKAVLLPSDEQIEKYRMARSRGGEGGGDNIPPKAICYWYQLVEFRGRGQSRIVPWSDALNRCVLFVRITD